MAVSFKQFPRILNLNRTPGRPKNRKKICLTFDEDKRKEFITGFRKRKLQRRQKAAEELQEKWKEEKKRIKEEIKKKYKTLLSQRDVPELEELLAKHEYEDDGKTVSILELNMNDLSGGSNWIGENRPAYEDPASKTTNSSEENHEDESDGEIPGMELNPKRKNKNENETDEENEDNECEIPNIPLSKAVQKETLKQTLKSQVFKRKQKWDAIKNRKKTHRKKVQKEKLIKKAQKKSKKSRKSS